MIENKQHIKSTLFQKLKEENAFWSYAMDGVEMVNDSTLIVKTLIHLDLPEIDMLFEIYPYEKVKKVWREELAIAGEYYHTLNRFLAWWYFKIKEPDKYLKLVETRHLNSC